MTPFEVLGYYRPKKWRVWTVGEVLTSFTRELRLIPLVDPVHGPQTWAPWYDETLHAEVKRRTQKNPKGAEWHKDGDLTPGSQMNCQIVLWCSNTPTEFISLDDGEKARTAKGNTIIYSPRAFEVVLFHNLECLHRRPANAKHHRWVFRQRIKP